MVNLRNIASNISTKAHHLADDVRDASSRNQKTSPGNTRMFTSRKGGFTENRGFGLHPVRGSIANGSDRGRGQRFVDLMSGSVNTTGMFAKSAVKSVASSTQVVAANIRDAATRAPASEGQKGYGIHPTDDNGNRETERTSIANNFVDTVSGGKNIIKSIAREKIDHAILPNGRDEIVATDDLGVEHNRESWEANKGIQFGDVPEHSDDVPAYEPYVRREHVHHQWTREEHVEYQQVKKDEEGNVFQKFARAVSVLREARSNI